MAIKKGSRVAVIDAGVSGIATANILKKMPNVFAEIFSRYGASDYKGIFEEYERKKAKRIGPLRTLPLDT